jgi:hypothetical protein
MEVKSAMRNVKQFAILWVAVLVIAIVMLAIWLDFPHTGSNAIYQTPISLEAAATFTVDKPILSKEQAVLAARRNLTTSRIRFFSDPVPVYIKRLTYREADHIVKSPEESHHHFSQPEDTMVWLVIYSGQFWIDFCPEGNCTPEPSGAGCAYAVLAVQDGSSFGMGSRRDCQQLFGKITH